MVAYVNSITQLAITIPSSTSSVTSSFSPATGIYVPWFQGFNVGGSSTVNQATVRAGVTAFTTSSITVGRNTSSASSVTVYVALMDATSNLISSFQFGFMNMSSGSSITSSITTVSISSLSVHALGYLSTVSSFNMGQNTPYLTWTASSVTGIVRTRSGTCRIPFGAIEWASSALNSPVQFVTNSWTNSASSNTKALSSTVVAANSMVVWAGCDNDLNETNAIDQQTIQLNSSGSSLTYATGSAPGDPAIIGNCSVVEFISSVLTQSVQRGYIQLSSASSVTSSVTSSATATSLLNFVGFSTATSSAATLATIYPAVYQATASSISSTLGSSGTVKSSWELISFAVDTGIAVTVDMNMPLEVTALVKTDLFLQEEFIATQKRDINLPDEWLTGILRSALFPDDEITDQRRAIISHYESLIVVGSNSGRLFEATATQTIGRPLQDENITSLSHGMSFPEEATTSQSTDRILPFENTGAVQITIDCTLPFEFIAGCIIDKYLSDEILAQIGISRGTALENITNSLRDVTLHEEWLGTISNGNTASLESMLNVIGRRLFPDEFNATQSNATTLQDENITGQQLSRIIADECLARAGINPRLHCEYVAGVLSRYGLPLETVAITGTVITDSLLPFEFKASQTRAQTLPLEFRNTRITLARVILSARHKFNLMLSDLPDNQTDLDASAVYHVELMEKPKFTIILDHKRLDTIFLTDF